MNQQERNRRRAFGQNFLIDEGVTEQLVVDVEGAKGDWILEVGPGKGAITKRLLNNGAMVTAVEADSKWVEYLRNHLQEEPFEVIHQDASRVSWDRLEQSKAGLAPSASRSIFVGNLPYNMSGPILRHFMPVLHHFHKAHVMVQYEVGKRIVAEPGNRNYGYLSAWIQNYAYGSIVQKIPPECFRPKPRVFSATLDLFPREAPIETDPKFPLFLQGAFSQKRKKLTNSLGSVCPKGRIQEALEKHAVDANVRPEELSVEQFATLFGDLKGHL